MIKADNESWGFGQTMMRSKEATADVLKKVVFYNVSNRSTSLSSPDNTCVTLI